MADENKRHREILFRVIQFPESDRDDAIEKECDGDPLLEASVRQLIREYEATNPTRFIDPIRRDNHDENQTEGMDRQEFDPLVVQLAEEFGDRVRSAESPSIDDYAHKYPQHAAQIRQLFPAMLVMEKFAEATVPFESHNQSGTVIDGKYALKQKLGQGGMGEVWVAKQNQPVKRTVALKVIKSGLDLNAVLSRFEQERQALAMMEHPNVAQVLDGGVTENGQPYFVMELVNGLPLNRFCDEARLSLKGRLELFVGVCRAVQHAHQKGIVHRDLKPANILVTKIEGKPVPKIIDFGVAKSVGGKLTDDTIETQFGAVVGTLEYMSPEQAGFSGEDIDTRTDIYSLGVILYELMTGLRPVDRQSLRRAALDEVVRVIREVAPSKPSTRLSSSDSLPSLAAMRQIDPRKLISLLRGDLDWIALKCLEKNRERRYETANSLAREIERFLNHEAIEARPPSTWYRTSKFIAKHRTFFSATVAFVLLLVAGTGISLWFAFDADHARQLAQLQEEKTVEEQQKTLAQLNDANAMLKILSDSFQSVSPDSGADAKMTAKDVLENALESIEDSNLNDVGRIRMLSTLADCFNSLSEYELAIEACDICLPLTRKEKEPRLELSILSILATAKSGAGQIKKALKIREQILKAYKKLPNTNQVRLLTAMLNLSNSYNENGRLKDALLLREEVYTGMKDTLGPDDPDTLRAMNNLAVSYQDNGKASDAHSMFEEVLTRRENTLGVDDPETLGSLHNLAYSFDLQGEYQTAIDLYLKTVKLRTNKLGPNHRTTLSTQANLANCYYLAGNQKEARRIYQSTLEAMKAKQGDEHPDTLAARQNLVNFYIRAGHSKLALQHAEKVVQVRSQKWGDTNLDTLVAKQVLANCRHANGQTEEAIILIEKVLESLRGQLETEDERIAGVIQNQARFLDFAGETNEALKLRKEALRIRRVLYPEEDHPKTLLSLDHLAISFAKTGDFDAAIETYEKVLKLRRKKFGPDHPTTVSSMCSLASALSNNRRQLSRAIELFGTALTIRTADSENFTRSEIGSVERNLDITIGNIQQQAFKDFQNGRFEHAEEILDAVLQHAGPHRTESFFSDTHKLIHWSLMGQRKWKSALATIDRWESSIEVDDETQEQQLLAMCFASRAVCHLEIDELEKAKNAAQKAIEIEQAIEFSLVQALSVLAMLNATEGDSDSAKKYEEKAKAKLESNLDSLPQDLKWCFARSAAMIHTATMLRQKNGEASDQDVSESKKWLADIESKISPPG